MIDFERISPQELKTFHKPALFGIDDVALAIGGSALLGGIFGSKGSKSTTTSSIPNWLADYWSGAIEEGKKNYQFGGPMMTGGQWEDINGVPTYTGGTPTYTGDPTLYSPANPLMQESWDLVGDFARAPGELETGGRNVLADTLSGRYLNPETNPAVGQYANYLYSNLIAPERAKYAKYGILSGSDYGNTQGQIASDIGSRIYESERQRMMDAVNNALPYESYRLGRYNLLGDVGREQRGLDIERREEPWKRLNLLTGIIQGVPGGQGTTTTTTPGNWLSGAAGGGLTAYSLLNQYGGGGGNTGTSMYEPDWWTNPATNPNWMVNY